MRIVIRNNRRVMEEPPISVKVCVGSSGTSLTGYPPTPRSTSSLRYYRLTDLHAT